MDHGFGRALLEAQAGPFHISRVVHRPGFRLGTHDHPQACLHYVVSGVYSERVGRRTLDVGTRRIVLKPPHARHSNHFDRGSETLRIDVAGGCEGLDRVFPVTVREFEDGRAQALCEEILRELREDDDCSAVSLHGLCLQLFAATGRRAGIRLTSSPAREPTTVRRAAEFLHEQYRGPVCFTSLAAELGVGRSRLAVSFRRHRGCSLGEFVRRLRVEHVLRGLAGGEQGLSELSLDAGFSDQSHCTRVLKSITGRTPGQWRQALANTRTRTPRSF